MKRFFALLFALMLLAGLVVPALAQSVEYRLDVNRDFGYGSGGNVRGNFSMKPYGNLDAIQSVTYLMDGQEIASLSEPPFVFRFATSSYPDGYHDLTAQVQTKDGRTVTTPVVRLNFLSLADQNAGMQKIFIPVIGLLVVITVIGIGAQFLTTRSNQRLPPGAPRHYGLKGGAICPRCGRPYAIHFMSINLLAGVLDRCPYCGKFAIVRSRSQQELRAAEQAELAAAQAAESAPIGSAAGPDSEEERIRKLLDQSRYTDQK